MVNHLLDMLALVNILEMEKKSMPSILKSKFVPELCCEHTWLIHMDDYSPNPTRFYCRNCSAVCIRDETGQILHYSADALQHTLDV